MGPDMLLTSWARPYKDSEDTLFYADLIYREWSGWDVGIQVQNLTRQSQAVRRRFQLKRTVA